MPRNATIPSHLELHTTGTLYKEGADFGEWWQRDHAHNIDSKMCYDCLTINLYSAIQKILLSEIICIRLTSNCNIRNYLYPAIQQNLLSMHPYVNSTLKQLGCCHWSLVTFCSIQISFKLCNTVFHQSSNMGSIWNVSLLNAIMPRNSCLLKEL